MEHQADRSSWPQLSSVQKIVSFLKRLSQNTYLLIEVTQPAAGLATCGVLGLKKPRRSGRLVFCFFRKSTCTTWSETQPSSTCYVTCKL